MANPFATGLRSLFKGPRSVAAVYRPKAGGQIDCRVIIDRRSQDAEGEHAKFRLKAAMISLQRADVAEPKKGDRIEVGGEMFEVAAPPAWDAEALCWMLDAPPVG